MRKIWGILSFDTEFLIGQEIENEPIFRVLKGIFAETDVPLVASEMYRFCLGGLCYYERKWRKYTEEDMMKERLFLYSRLFMAIKDIFELGFIPIDIGRSTREGRRVSKILMLSGGPPWKEPLAQKLKASKTFSFGPSQQPMSVKQVEEAMEELGLRAPTMAELSGLLGDSGEEKK